MAIRVIQWTTGNVGRRTLAALIAKPSFDLVGVYAHGPDKVGRDAAELCGIAEPTGVIATDDVAALLALKPDACVFSGRWFDVDTVCKLLEAGVNVVTHSAFITGRWLGEETRERLQRAGVAGGASLFGTGINPGFANVIAVASTQLCARVDQIRVTESVDSTHYDSWETETKVGFGQLPGTPGITEGAREATEVFGDAVEMMANAMSIEFDAIVFDMEVATASADTDLGYAHIAAGTISAVDGKWRGQRDGKDVIILRFRWLKGPHVPDFAVDHGYTIEVDGNPGVITRVNLMPPAGWDGSDPMAIGMTATGLPAVNAIAAVVAAPPGIVTFDTIAGYGAFEASV